MIRSKCIITALFLAAAAGCPSVASAEVNTRVSILMSLNGSPYTPTAMFPGGTGYCHVDVRITMEYIGTAPALGLASAVFQPVVSGYRPLDFPEPFVNGGTGSNTSIPPGVVPDAPGQFGRISPFGRTALGTAQALTNFQHDNYLRIAQRTATAFIGGPGNTTGGQGVPIAQLSNVGRTSSDPAFNPSLTVNVFRFGFNFDTFIARELTIDIPADGFGNRDAATGERQVYWFADMLEVTGSLRGTALVIPARIIMPAPGVTMLFGFGAISLRRRSR